MVPVPICCTSDEISNMHKPPPPPAPASHPPFPLSQVDLVLASCTLVSSRGCSPWRETSGCRGSGGFLSYSVYCTAFLSPHSPSCPRAPPCPLFTSPSTSLPFPRQILSFPLSLLLYLSYFTSPTFSHLSPVLHTFLFIVPSNH